MRSARLAPLICLPFLWFTACSGSKGSGPSVDAEGVMGRNQVYAIPVSASALKVVEVDQISRTSKRYSKQVGQALQELGVLPFSEIHFSADFKTLAIAGEERPYFKIAESLNSLDENPEPILISLNAIIQGLTGPSPTPISYPAGSLDLSFGNGTGYKVLTVGGPGLGSGYGPAEDVVVTGNGKILISGSEGTSLVLFQLNLDGTPDLSFGVNGKLTDPICVRKNNIWVTFVNSTTAARGIAVQSDGKIVVGCGGVLVGTKNNEAWSGNNNLARYLANGTSDTSFGTLGTPGYARFPGIGSVHAVKVDLNNSIYLKADSDGLDSSKVALAAKTSANGDVLNWNTAIDGGFMGSVVYSSGLLVDTLGGVLATLGYTFKLQRLLPNGTTDASFGDSGTTTGDGDFSRQVKQLKSGKYIVGGSPWGAAHWQLHRYNANGTSDNSFGDMGNGKAQYVMPMANLQWLDAMAEQANGKLLVAGAIRVANTYNEVVWSLGRFTPEGVLDQTFGQNGIVRLESNPNAVGAIYGMTIQPDGAILAVGDSAYGRMAVFRFHP